MRIVTTDDSEITAPELKSRFRDLGHEVVAHGFNGEEGVKLCREHRPDVAVFDIAMPRMTGDIAARIVKDEGIATHIVLATSQGQAQFFKVAEELGAHILIKPYSLGQLQKVMEQICESHQ